MLPGVTDTATEYLLLDEIATALRAPLSSVRHWISTGKLRSIRPGRRRLVRRADLDRFLAARADETTNGEKLGSPEAGTPRLPTESTALPAAGDAQRTTHDV